MDKLPEKKIKYENKITKWFNDYWYYYKWRVIIAAFLLFVVIVCTVQACSNTEDDVVVLYAGEFLSTSPEVPNIESALSSVLPEDISGDGKKTVSMSMMNVYSEERIKELEERGYKISRPTNDSELSKFQDLIVTGEFNVCLLDPWLYETVKKQGGFAKLEDTLGYIPDSAVDEYAIKLSDTDFGKYFAGVKSLPEDTYLCIRTPGALQSMFGAKSEKLDYAVKLVRAIVEYKAPEEK